MLILDKRIQGFRIKIIKQVQGPNSQGTLGGSKMLWPKGNTDMSHYNNAFAAFLISAAVVFQEGYKIKTITQCFDSYQNDFSLDVMST